MKRDREGDVVPGTVPAPISPSVNSHSLPLPRVPVSNGATTANGVAVPKANGNGTIGSSGNVRKPRANWDAGTSRPVPVTGLPTPGSAGGMSASATASPSIPASLAPNVSSAPSSAYKRAKFGIIEPPEGWREVAEGLLRARKEGEEPTAEEGEVTEKQSPRSHRQYAAVCSANFNRSMMAHKLMQKHGFRVESYGTGRDVRLPGKDVGSPEVFPFGTPYLEIYDTLKGKDEEFFRRNNLLGLVARNATIKTAPERFQDISGPAVANFDVVLCFDSRVFYLVVEDLQSRDPEMFKPLHVVNMTIKDSPEESAAAAGDVLEVCSTLDGLDSLEDEAAEALDAFAKKTRRTILHQVCHV